MTITSPAAVHGKSAVEYNKTSMEPQKGNTYAEKAPLKENISIQVESPKINDIHLKKKWLDPAGLLRQKTWQLMSYISDASPWACALGSATLFMIPLLQCMDVQCMVECLPTNICNIWYTKVIVITTIIILNLLMAALICVKSDVVKICSILNYTLLVFYYVLGLVLFIALQPYDTHLALHIFGVTCAMAFPSWILSRSIVKKPKVRIVYVSRAHANV